VQELTKTAVLDAFFNKRAALERFLIARFRDATAAEDILQEMYLKLSRTTFDTPVDNINAFLYRVANNLALDFRKTAVRQQDRDTLWGETTTHHMGGEPIDETVDVETKLDAQKKLKQVIDSMNDLPPQCRRVFVAHKFEELSYKEVAEKLNISRSTVEKHMSKALKYLADKLQDET